MLPTPQPSADNPRRPELLPFTPTYDLDGSDSGLYSAARGKRKMKNATREGSYFSADETQRPLPIFCSAALETQWPWGFPPGGRGRNATRGHQYWSAPGRRDRTRWPVATVRGTRGRSAGPRSSSRPGWLEATRAPAVRPIFIQGRARTQSAGHIFRDPKRKATSP